MAMASVRFCWGRFSSAVRIFEIRCGFSPSVVIRKDSFTYFDFSKDYILDSVDGILERLQIERLDSLLLHRPDALMEPEEVAAAFDHLEQVGKARHFGVSNQNPMMMELLKTAVKQRLKVQPVAVECRPLHRALRLVFMLIWKVLKQPCEMAVSLSIVA